MDACVLYSDWTAAKVYGLHEKNKEFSLLSHFIKKKKEKKTAHATGLDGKKNTFEFTK